MPLTLTQRGTEERVPCPGCRRDILAVAWPAVDRGAARPPLPRAVTAGEAGCFSCANRVATGVCDGCGAYTCPACEAPWFGESLCLTCLHARREVLDVPKYRRRLLLHDNIALTVLILPAVLIPFYGLIFSMLAAPVVLFLVIRHRKAPRGLPPRGPFRLWLAGSLAVLLLLGAVAGIGLVGYALVQVGEVMEEIDSTASPAGGAPGSGSGGGQGP